MLLQEIIPWGRTLREYELMFALTEADKNLKILGCGDGPASFNAEWTASGGNVISIDPVYEFSAAEIQARFEAVRENIMAAVEASPEKWSWSFHKNSQDLLTNRTVALQNFLVDYEAGKQDGRYQIGELPKLAFKDHAFDVAICSHLLFLYSNLLSFDFHLAALLELCRVAHDVRVFPLLDLTGNESQHLNPIRLALKNKGIQTSLEQVNYEFQKGGNQMLRIFSN